MKEFTHSAIKEENLKFKSGIYRLIVNKKSYIGSSVNLDNRLREHCSDLNTGNHYNKKLLNAFKKYGKVHFEIVEFCSEDCLLEKENYYYEIEGYYNLQSPDRLKNSQAKTTYQYSLEGELINTYISTGDAARKTGIHQTAISGACNNKIRSYAGGYLWSYALENKKRRITGIAKPVYMYDLNGEFVKEFYSGYDGARYLKDTLMLKAGVPSIANAIRTSRSKNGTIKVYGYLFTDYHKDKILKHKKV